MYRPRLAPLTATPVPPPAPKLADTPLAPMRMDWSAPRVTLKLPLRLPKLPSPSAMPVPEKVMLPSPAKAVLKLPVRLTPERPSTTAVPVSEPLRAVPGPSTSEPLAFSMPT